MNYLDTVRQTLASNNISLKIIEGDKSYDNASANKLIHQYMSYIDSHGIGQHSQIAILPSRKAEWIFFMYALMFKGVAPLIVDHDMSMDSLSILLRDMDIIYGDRERRINNVKIRALPRLSSIDDMDNLELNVVHRQDGRLFTAHTSGTTGLPKKVNYTNDNMMWALNEYKRIYNLDVNESILFSLPFHYCYSVIPCCIVPMALGKTIVISSEMSSTEMIANLIEKQKINILVVNPLFYKNLSSLDLSKYNFSSLRICDSGGESIPIPVVNKMKEKTDVLITEGYGLTETTSLTHFLLPDTEGKLRIGSVGRACEQVECRIVDENYSDVKEGCIGELLIKGPMVAPYDSPDQNEDANIGGWFKTGDLFYADAEGFYYLVSRKKDAIDISTEMANLAAINIPLLLSNELIEDISYKFLSADELHLFIVASDDANQPTLQGSILGLLPEELSNITIIKFVGLLPRTTTGKVLKKDL
jgi:long-chain acyl-CoA synthetase